MQVPERPLWGDVPQDASRAPSLMPDRNLPGQPLPPTPCHGNLNDLTTKSNVGRIPGNWAGSLHFIFHTLQLAFKKSLQTSLSFPFSGCSAKGRLPSSLNHQCQSKRAVRLWDSAFWDALDEAGAPGPRENPFPASLAEVAVGPKQLINRSVKAERNEIEIN